MAAAPQIPWLPGPQYQGYSPYQGDTTAQMTQGGINYIGAQPYQNNIPYISNQNPSDAWQNQRMLQQQMQDQWMATQGPQAAAYQTGESGYGNLVQQVYNPIWGGGGGYTPQMQAQVQNQAGLDDIAAQQNANYLNFGEMQGIQGNPLQAFNYAQQPLQQQQGQLQSSQQGALRPYQAGVGGALAQGQASINDPGLQITPQYLQQAGLTDQDVQNFASAAGADVGAQYQGAITDLQSRAAASGMVNPLAVAGQTQAYLRGQAADTSQAMNTARMNARMAQAQQAQNIQNTQLGAAGTRANLGLNYMGQDVGAQQGLAQTQLGAAQNLANYGQGNIQYLGGLQGTAEQQAQQRAAMMATNRQQMQQANQGMLFNINQAGSQRAQQAYAPWLQAQQEGRQAAVQQQGYYGGRTQDVNQLQLQGWQLGQQGTQGALQGKNQWDAISRSPNQSGAMSTAQNVTGMVSQFI